MRKLQVIGIELFKEKRINKQELINKKIYL